MTKPLLAINRNDCCVGTYHQGPLEKHVIERKIVRVLTFWHSHRTNTLVMFVST